MHTSKAEENTSSNNPNLNPEIKIDFKEVVDYVSEGIYITDNEGKTLYINKPFENLSGFGKELLIGKYIMDLESAGIFKNTVTATVLKTQKRVDSVAEVMSTGKKFLLIGNPVFDEHNNIKMVITSSRNVTDLVNMQSELAQTKEKIKVVTEKTQIREQELKMLRKMNQEGDLISESWAMRQVDNMIQRIAKFDTTVLITGETGTGKEVIANKIHSVSDRSSMSFIKVNCAAIPANLLESELFGYEKGAFTGANTTGKLGMFELANKGTILLDEIGDLPLELQPKLLRTIQQKELTCIGGTKPIKLDVRLIASTNCDLKKLVNEGKFREDLYYRLSVFPIHVLPLRSRTEDILPLVNHFLIKYNIKYNKHVSIDQEGMDTLNRYSWPGNIREVHNIVERLVIVSESQAMLGSQQVSELLGIDTYYIDLLNKELSLKEMVAEFEKRTIEKIMSVSKNTRIAADKLRMDQSTLVKKSKRLGINLSR